MTSTDRTAQDHQEVGSAAEERLWDSLYRARAGKAGHLLADLEDAAFRLYLPMARTLAHSVSDPAVDRITAEQAAELGLAHAVLAWKQPTGSGFRRFARVTIMRQLLSL